MDRNILGFGFVFCQVWSLSVRRAWIEIFGLSLMMQQATQSLSVRRAWIEMNITLYQFAKKLVALRKESVDRNWNLVDQAPEHRGRSP